MKTTVRWWLLTNGEKCSHLGCEHGCEVIDFEDRNKALRYSEALATSALEVAVVEECLLCPAGTEHDVRNWPAHCELCSVVGPHPTCEQCSVVHDCDDLPPKCEQCGVCLGVDWNVDDAAVCEECEAESRECQCPGGEELGPCHCPACAGGGKGR